MVAELLSMIISSMILAIEMAAIESMSACADGGLGLEIILAIGMVVMGSMFAWADGGLGFSWILGNNPGD